MVTSSLVYYFSFLLLFFLSLPLYLSYLLFLSTFSFIPIFLIFSGLSASFTHFPSSLLSPPRGKTHGFSQIVRLFKVWYWRGFKMCTSFLKLNIHRVCVHRVALRICHWTVLHENVLVTEQIGACGGFELIWIKVNIIYLFSLLGTCIQIKWSPNFCKLLKKQKIVAMN